MAKSNVAVVRRFQRAPDAFVAASILKSEGIDATVVDDSEFGGNAFGALPANIHLEVEDTHFERALAILNQSDLDEVPNSDTDAAEVAPDAPQVALFRLLVIAELILFLGTSALSEFFFYEPPAAVANWLAGLPHSPILFSITLDAWWVLMALAVLSSCFLATFISAGRPLFIATVAWGLFGFGVSPPIVLTRLGTVVGGLHWMLVGGILILMFSPQISARFAGSVEAVGSRSLRPDEEFPP